MGARRELFAFAVAPLLVAAIYFLPGWVFLVILTVAVLLAGDELLTMARGAGFDAGRVVPLVILACVLIAAWVWGERGLLGGLILAVVSIPAVRLPHRRGPSGSFAGIAVATFTVSYLGVTAACLGWLRVWPGDHHGVRFLLFFLAVIWIGDSGAYYVGSHFGHRKLAPRISPNKTWEGFAGGVVTTYAAAVAAALILGVGIATVHILALATILAIAAPLGDLVESILKRDSGVKDSSSILPGHGGFLDRTDSLLWSAPPVLGYLLITGLVR